MAKFLSNSSGTKVPVVTLDQDDDEVNILVDGILVAWFDDGGSLRLAALDDDDEETLNRFGVSTSNGYIRVTKA